MIDPENEVYTRVINAVLAEMPDVKHSSTWVSSPAEFPFVSLTLLDSHDLGTTWDSGGMAVGVFTFHVNVYSKKVSGARQECKRIIALIDDEFSNMNARRESMTSLPNIEDATIYRMSASYIVATDGKYFYLRR